MKYEKVLKEVTMDNLSIEELREVTVSRCIQVVNTFFEKVDIIKLDFIDEAILSEWLDGNFIGEEEKKSKYNEIIEDKKDNFYDKMENLANELSINKVKHMSLIHNNEDKSSTLNLVDSFFREALFLLPQYENCLNIEEIKKELIKLIQSVYNLNIKYENEEFIVGELEHLTDRELLLKMNIFLFEVLNYEYEEFNDLYDEMKMESEDFKNTNDFTLYLFEEVPDYIF